MSLHLGPSPGHDQQVRTIPFSLSSSKLSKNDHRYTDLPSLVSWLSARQYAPEGGFSGRTNKLVDGCYSHWVGGCWPLVQQALDAGTLSAPRSLYSREGLSRYILNCCQSQYGGLRDKPGKYVR